MVNRRKIGDKYYYYDPVTSEDVECNDMILDKAYLSDPNTHLLTCIEVDSIFNVEKSWKDKGYAYYTGFPELFDNCGTPTIVQVTDVVVDYSCEYRTDPMVPNRQVSKEIIRTFVYEDWAGNRNEVSQTICFFRPLIILPDCKVKLDACWYDNDSSLNPSDIGSVPYYETGACMKMPLLDHTCSFTVTYEDVRLPGPVDCGDKIIRTWTVLDWCWDDLRAGDYDIVKVADDTDPDHGCPSPDYSSWNNKKLTWEQHLIIGDDEKPIVECPAADPDWYGGSPYPVFSVNPFDCKASFEVPAPRIKNNKSPNAVCDFTWTVKVYTEKDILWHDVPTGETEVVANEYATVFTTNGTTVVSNLEKGMHYFKYIVEDRCGNVGESEYCPFYVIDQIAPSAVCDDQLNISIGGENYARVFATDLDEGSRDDCTDVKLETRRFIKEECLEAFLAYTEIELDAIYVATSGRDKNGNPIPDPITLDKPSSVNDGLKGYYTPWADHADFVCCDIKDSILIELRVWDNANMSRDDKNNPIFGDEVYMYGESYTQKDNYNICWLEVLVEDKLPPICKAPKDIEVDCKDVPVALPETSVHDKSRVIWNEAEINDPANAEIIAWLSTYDAVDNSTPTATDNCRAETTLRRVIFDVHCKAGKIERYWGATDEWEQESNNTCRQIIWLNRHHDYCIKFPKDAEAVCGEPMADNVEIEEYGCDLLAVSIQEERFDVTDSEGGCYKLFRTYRVINWCQFDADVDPDTPLFDRFDTEYDLEPLVVGRDEDCDEWPGDEDVYVRFKGEVDKANGYIDGTTWIDSDCEPWNDSPKANKGCDNPWGHWRELDYTGGFYQYTQIIKVIDNIAPEVTAIGEENFPTYATPDKGEDKAAVCVGTVNRVIQLGDECSPAGLSIDKVVLRPDADLALGAPVLYENNSTTDAGVELGFAIAISDTAATLSGAFPIGAHAFEVTVSDGCGNETVATVPFTVYDDKAPAPICLSGLTVALMPVDENNDGIQDEGKGMAAIWAKDFIASDVWDCSEPISYSIHRADLVDSGVEVPEPGQTNLMVDCEDSEVVVVYIYAWDTAGNGDRCEALLLLTDSQELCDPTTSGSKASIAGAVFTEELRTVESVEMNLSGGMTMNNTTSVDGAYTFTGIDRGYDYTVSPLNDLDHVNGVSTFDLIEISKHILGVEPLGSPYKMIAADVNNSKSITTLDLINIRKLILRIDREYANNTSWRFINADYEFPNPENPWIEQFPEVFSINDIEQSVLKADFIGIKIGDVNGSAVANSEGFIYERYNGEVFNLEVEEQTLGQHDTYEIPFTASDLNQVKGYQMTLAWATDQLEFVGIKTGLMEENSFGTTFVEEGMLTMSYYHQGEVDPNAPLFTLVVKARQAISLSEALRVSSRHTIAEAYPLDEDTGAEVVEVALAFSNGTSVIAGYELYQNIPNPFENATQIGFYLPKATTATLTIRDAMGKLLRTYEGNYAKGQHNILVKSNELGNPTGVLFYTLETEDYQQTKQMTAIK